MKLWALTFWALAACTTTRVGVTRPSIFSAGFHETEGHQVLKVVATGFTPVRSVWLVTDDGARVYEVPQATDKTYVLDLGGVLAPDAPRPETAKIVVVDIEGDEQAETLRLPLQRTAH